MTSRVNDELRMLLADCGSPEKIAQIIHDNIPLFSDGCVDLEKVAYSVGITELTATNDPALEGALVTKPPKSEGAILFNESSNEYRRRFTIAHELGHFLILTHDKNAQCKLADMNAITGNDVNIKTEIEANRFAIELLAPKKSVSNILDSKKYMDIQQLIDISNRFKISKEAAARRYIDCTDYDFVLILFGHKDKVRYFLKTEEFPYVNLAKGNDIPPHITEQIKGKSPGEVTDWYCMDPEHLLDDFSLMDKEFCLQTLIQRDNYHISLLSLEEK